MLLRRTALAITVTAALAASACAADPEPVASEPALEVTPSTAASTEAPSPAPTDAVDPAGGGGTQINVDELNAWALAAIATAEESAGGAALKIDDDNDDQVWEVDVLSGDKVVEITVDREGLTVVDTQDDGAADEDDRAAAGDLVKAINAALASTPGALDNAELDEEDGAAVWKVELDRTNVGDDVEIRVDASTFQATVDG